MASNQQIVDALDEMTRSSDNLEKELTKLRGETVRLEKDATKSRRNVRLLVASVIFDILLSVGLGWVAYKANDAATEAKLATTTARVNANNLSVICKANNENNAVNHQLWTFILNLPPEKPPTADELKRRQEFITFINKSFAQRDCDD